jgi:hypothetical protein
MTKFVNVLMFVITLSIITGPVFAADIPTDEKMNPYGSLFVGTDVVIEMAQFEEVNEVGLHDVLLKISGPLAYVDGIDGQVLRYQATHGGSGVDYSRNGEIRMSSRSPYDNSWTQTQVFLSTSSIDVGKDTTRSKEVHPLHLLTALQNADAK